MIVIISYTHMIGYGIQKISVYTNHIICANYPDLIIYANILIKNYIYMDVKFNLTYNL